MANDKDARVTEILSRYGEDLKTATWMVQGTRVIYHAALERIAVRASIKFEMPTIVRAEAEEAVVLVQGWRGRKDDGWFEWSIGEARITAEGRPGNYRVTGKQAAYPYAMAEKRAKDRVILKLIELSGDVYSEEEADEFKDERPGPARRDVMSDAISSGKPVVLEDGEVHPGEAFKRFVREQGTAIGVKNFVLRHEVQTFLSDLPEDQRNELREFALARMQELGWSKRNG